MKRLTQEVAERCARACGLPRRYKEAPLHPESCIAHITEQVKVKNRWINLPLDPYFWRPRLEDELTKIVVGKWGRPVEITRQTMAWGDRNEVKITIGDLEKPWLATEYFDSHEEALYKAIEKLKGVSDE